MVSDSVETSMRLCLDPGQPREYACPWQARARVEELGSRSLRGKARRGEYSCQLCVGACREGCRRGGANEDLCMPRSQDTPPPGDYQRYSEPATQMASEDNQNLQQSHGVGENTLIIFCMCRAVWVNWMDWVQDLEGCEEAKAGGEDCQVVVVHVESYEVGEAVEVAWKVCNLVVADPALLEPGEIQCLERELNVEKDESLGLDRVSTVIWNKRRDQRSGFKKGSKVRI